ncbi:hypothetical protein PCAR4_680055 [Paraburkholderia caribensis]|nr:hypothetical protein PCAR4_680055 [Paraburkholderia caribensis]
MVARDALISFSDPNRFALRARPVRASAFAFAFDIAH